MTPPVNPICVLISQQLSSKLNWFFVVPPHYFSMLLTIGDLNNAQIICFHFPPPPPFQQKNVFAFLLLRGLLHKLAFNSKSVMGLQFFEGFCWGTKLFSNLQEICQKNEPWCRTTFQTCNSFSATIIVFNSCSQFDIQCQVHGWREGNHTIIKDLIRWAPIIKSIAKK